MAVVPASIAAFFDTPTPDEWVLEAGGRLPELLLDHANCELKAASTALGFLYRYPDRGSLAQRMSKLAREELRHFEQVRSIMDEMAVPFERLSASRYAGRLRQAAPDAIVMHPGPINRGIELDSGVADGPRSVILQQVSNGVAIRMAALWLLLSDKAQCYQ